MVTDVNVFFLTHPRAVLSARLTHTGMPLLIMHNHHAYTYHKGWCSWMRVADDAFPASHFHSSLSSNQGAFV